MFKADSLHGKWKEVKNYKHSWGNEARPGGRFLKIKNSWYLPMQTTEMVMEPEYHYTNWIQ